jgi:hypothetical protein
MKTTKVTKQPKVEFCKEEELLMEAVELIQYFVKRVEEGSIRSKTTYKKYKDFLNEYENYLQ